MSASNPDAAAMVMPRPRATAGAGAVGPRRYDGTLLFVVLFMVGIGIVMVYSASSSFALRHYGSDAYFLKRQMIFSLLGIIALVLCSHVPFRLYRSLAYPILILSICLLAAVQWAGVGHTAGGAKRWIDLGFFSFQPSEFARLALVIYLAYSLHRKQELIREFSVGFLPHMMILGIFTLFLIIQPDFGSVVIFGMLTWVMMFVGGVRLIHLFPPLLLILPVGYTFMMTAEYRVRRLMSFLDPWQYPTDEGYQIIHSLMAFGTGGIWGNGIGKSYQKLFYLPESHTDFIFSVIGEELGLLGVLFMIGLFGVIIWKGLTIARKSQDLFGSFLAMGISTALGLQVCINLGVVLGLLPTKGLTLPFLSYGGTSLLLNMASVGILINIGYHAQRAAFVTPPTTAARHHYR
jgi:cell division protein FtsW